MLQDWLELTLRLASESIGTALRVCQSVQDLWQVPRTFELRCETSEEERIRITVRMNIDGSRA